MNTKDMESRELKMISVVIPSYNAASTIAPCLNSLQQQTYGGEYEIILVDSSKDGTSATVAEYFPQVRLVHLDDQTDPGTARNMGVQRARGQIIAFIDADCIASRDWLENIVNALTDHYGAVGGAVLNGNSASDIVGLSGYLIEFRDFIPGRPQREVMHIPTCNIAYFKTVFEEAGPFKGEYYPQEDLVYNHALAERGIRILWEPSIRVYHRHRSTLKDFLLHQLKIGAATVRVLLDIDLPGSWIARHPLPAIALVPFLPVVKWIKTVAVFMNYQPAMILMRPHVLIPFSLGLVYWMWGFAREMWKVNTIRPTV